MLKYGVLVITVLISSILILVLLFPPSRPYSPNPNTFYFKAAIVDHLSLSAPNQTFAQTATTILQNGGFTVDYYSGEKVNVEFYRNLPKHDYGVILLRVHSAVGKNNNPPLALFTSEPLDTSKYKLEILFDQLQGVAFLPYKPGDPKYFGIPPKFVSDCMSGTFENTIIIAMGCNGLTYTDMAKAFIYKGAKAYISWSSTVTASHTDAETEKLLRHLVTERKTVWHSVSQTSTDPTTYAHLTYYPSGAGTFIIPQKSPTNNFPTPKTAICVCEANFYNTERFSANMIQKFLSRHVKCIRYVF